MDFSKFGEYGLIGLFMGVVLFIFWRMIVWIMAFVKDIITQHNSERANWKCALDKMNDTQNMMQQTISRHDEKAEERGRYVREEHKQMIEALGRINGYKGGH